MKKLGGLQRVSAPNKRFFIMQIYLFAVEGPMAIRTMDELSKRTPARVQC
jgi:hypothetical protein